MHRGKINSDKNMGASRREIEWVDKKFPRSDRIIKIRKLLSLTSFVCTTLGAIWAACYLMYARLDFAVIFVGLFGVGVLSFFAAKKFNYFIFLIIAHSLLLIVAAISFFDTPLAHIPRSAHVFFLPLAMGVIFIFNQNDKYMGVVFPKICLLLFAAFGIGMLDAVHLEKSPPESIRLMGAYSNYIFSVLLLSCIIKIYRNDMNEKASLGLDLAQAVGKGEIVVHYQPQVDGQQKILGVEALVRWQHPERGLLSPDKFIPLAEENFLIRDIGIEVLRQSCQLLQLWAKDPVLKDKFIAVNVSPIQLDDDDFVATVQQVILEAGVEPQNIELELTESALCLSLVEARKKIQALREFGIRWALDDFGSGFSSLGILSVLPVHKLKIDRQFLKEVENSESSITLLRKILEISEVMGMEATVEGVENPSQFKMLVGLGCNSFQGYLFGRPQSAEQVTYAIKECASS